MHFAYAQASRNIIGSKQQSDEKMKCVIGIVRPKGWRLWNTSNYRIFLSTHKVITQASYVPLMYNGSSIDYGLITLSYNRGGCHLWIIVKSSTQPCIKWIGGEKGAEDVFTNIEREKREKKKGWE